ncbi:MAG: chromate transporter [Firmicutes bacterium]|nr:chromate transporter [Bacillota bacterium]
MDISLLLTLMVEFFKTGLFALGGGLATIPFLFEMSSKYHWFTTEMLMNMIAVSESTPGPMGVNMATYVGIHTTDSVIGGIITTLSLVAPSIIVCVIVAQFLKKFKESEMVQNAFYGLRPAVCAMIASAGLGIFVTTLFGEEITMNINWVNVILLILLYFFAKKFNKLHPIVLVCICAVLGIIFQL